MSSTFATRTTRFAPPSVPTRKATPRRIVTGPGSSVVGRVDRPVLRIVADDERAPVVTRVVVPAELELPETRTVDLDAFFAAEYDGDDVRLEVARPRRSTVRLTRRGRVVVLGAGVVTALGLGLLGATQALAGGQPALTHVITVQPGQTLWDIASASTPAGGDVRTTISHLEGDNHLDSAGLQVGQHLRVPR
jgi:LysM domain